VLASVNPVFAMVTVVAAIVLLLMGFWWLQATMAAKGDRANADHPGGDQRLAELTQEKRVAAAGAKVAAIVAGVALAIGVLGLVLTS
jgi:hypothetical protein